MESCIRIDIEAKLLIFDFSKSTGISMSSIAKLLLKKVDARFFTTPSKPGLINYQMDQPIENWDNLHYRLNQEEKEQFELMRSKYKLSISYLVLIGILLFFDELIEEFFGRSKSKNEIIDNYPVLCILKSLFCNSCWMLREKEP